MLSILLRLDIKDSTWLCFSAVFRVSSDAFLWNFYFSIIFGPEIVSLTFRQTCFDIVVYMLSKDSPWSRYSSIVSQKLWDLSGNKLTP